MSWATIAKKNTVKNTETVEKPKLEEKVIQSIDDEELPDEIFEWKLGHDLFDSIIDVKQECEKYTPWLMEHCRSGDMYHFFKDFIDVENTVKNYLQVDDDSSEETDEEYN